MSSDFINSLTFLTEDECRVLREQDLTAPEDFAHVTIPFATATSTGISGTLSAASARTGPPRSTRCSQPPASDAHAGPGAAKEGVRRHPGWPEPVPLSARGPGRSSWPRISETA